VSLNTGAGFGTAFGVLAPGDLSTSPPADFVQWGSNGILLISQSTVAGYVAYDGTTIYGPGFNPTGIAPPWLTGNTYIQATGNFNSGTSVTSIVSPSSPATGGFAVGQLLFSSAVPTGTFITAINSGTSITISQSALVTANFQFDVGATPNPTGNLHATTTIDGMSSTVGLFAGMSVFSTSGNLAANTTIATVVSSSSITISTAALTSNSGVQLAFQWPMPSGISGNAISIFQSRVFIENGAQTQISAPQNGANFATAQGGTSFFSTDSFLKSQYSKAYQSNGFQYLIGDSSINVISNIQTGGSPTETTFNNQNVDPQMGSIWKDTVQPFGRGIMFANPSGIYALYGGAAEKVSDKLDGLFANANFTTTTPTAGVATLFGVRVFLFNFNTIDLNGVRRNLMALWDGKKWFLASQPLVPIFIGTQEINSVLTIWGTDGTNLFQMFTTPSVTLSKILQTKLWSGDSYLVVKQALRNYCLGTDFSGNGFSLSGTLDTVSDVFGFVQKPKTLSAGLQFVQWQNNAAQNVQFVNNAAQNVNFLSNAVLSLLGTNVNAMASLLGETLNITGSDFTLVALTLLYKRIGPVGG
jgi:hypothetical protein